MTTAQQDDTGVIDAEFTIIESKTPLALYDVTDTAIAELKTELTGLTEYQAISKGIAKVRGLRVGIDNKRKELKAESLAWGRRVDSEAKRIIEQLEAIEEPLKLLKHKADEAKEKAKQEAEAARIAENLRRCECFKELEYAVNPFLVESMTAEEFGALLEIASDAHVEILRKRVQANAEAEAARLQAIADEAARVEALRVEREAIKAERAKLEAEKAIHAEAIAKVQADLKEARRIEAEAVAKQEAEHAEANRLHAEAMKAERDNLQAHWDKVAKDEADKLAAEAAEAEAAHAEAIKADREAAEAERVAAMQAEAAAKAPDRDKVKAYADAIALVLRYTPIVSNDDSIAFLGHVNDKLAGLVQELREWAE